MNDEISSLTSRTKDISFGDAQSPSVTFQKMHNFVTFVNFAPCPAA
jgi:hypothetical protein